MVSIVDIIRSFLKTNDERGRKTADWYRLIVRRETRKIAGEESGSILDAGGNDGLLFDPQASDLTRQVTILDLEKPALISARKHYRGEGFFVYGDITRMPFREGAFKTAVCIGTFYNLPSREVVRKGLDELARVTSPDGRVIVEFRNADNPMVRLAFRLATVYDKSLKDLPLKAYSLSCIQQMISESGMKIIRIKNVNIPCKPVTLAYIVEAKH